MALKKITPIKPSNYEWLIDFMSTVELNDVNKNQLVKAFVNYHKACYKAAKQLAKDLEMISQVKINN